MHAKKISIVQSNYIPWKGYFDMIAAVDEFIIYDDMQYTRRDWRNRNKIKTPEGSQWLTIPVKAKGKYFQRICDTEIDSSEWAALHWKALAQNYGRAPYYLEVASLLEPLYFENKYTHISQINRHFIESICAYLGIKTKISNSWDYILLEGKTERLLNLCMQTGCTEYVSGPAARNYLDIQAFTDLGIKLTWFDYDNYPVYSQLWGEFIHEVTVLDLLFNCGRDAPRYMRCVT